MFYQLEHIGTEGYFRKEEGNNFNYPLHLHQSFELILVDEGEMTITVNDTPYDVRKGEALLIFPNQLHSMQSTKSKHTLFIFSPHVIQSFFMEKTEKMNKVCLDFVDCMECNWLGKINKASPLRTS